VEFSAGGGPALRDFEGIEMKVAVTTLAFCVAALLALGW